MTELEMEGCGGSERKRSAQFGRDWAGVGGAEQSGQPPGRKPAPGQQERFSKHEAFITKANIAAWDGNADVLISGAPSIRDGFYFLDGGGNSASPQPSLLQQVCRECKGSPRGPRDCRVPAQAHHSTPRCYWQALIDSGGLIKQKQRDSFLLKGQTIIIF